MIVLSILDIETAFMWWPFGKKNQDKPDESKSIWKQDFSDCMAADFIPNYSVCQTLDNRHCRHVVMYSGMTLCGHPEHKSFIPKDAETASPDQGSF